MTPDLNSERSEVYQKSMNNYSSNWKADLCVSLECLSKDFEGDNMKFLGAY